MNQVARENCQAFLDGPQTFPSEDSPHSLYAFPDKVLFRWLQDDESTRNLDADAAGAERRDKDAKVSSNMALAQRD
jgi:hypothetical protein